MAYRRGSSLVVQREYNYDTLGRPTARNTARQGAVVNDVFAHNSRSELSSARVNGVSYGYAYDSIGNREFAVEGEDTAIYTANALNQYTRITENAESVFIPEFDADGNQTRIKTETGIWGAVYNSENRPVTFSNADSGIVIESAYDSMGRRTYKRVTLNGNVTLHQRYIYRGYLQIACIDLTRSHHPCMWLLCWDPTQSIATRPLAIQKDGTWYTYGLDLTKNVCEVFGTTGYINTAYTYTPYGDVTATGSTTQPIQWSSEFYDSELALVYYNYRHYNPVDGRWMSYDLIEDYMEHNSYRIKNTIHLFDTLGLRVNVLFYGDYEDVYADIEGDVMSMHMKGAILDENKKVLYYQDLINKLKEMPDEDFNRIVESGNLRQKKYKYIKSDGNNGNEFVYDKTLYDTKDEFIKRAERELKGMANIRELDISKGENLSAAILEGSTTYFKAFPDVKPYDFNVLLMHGASDGYVYYRNYRVAKIADLKTKFEKALNNTAQNYFFCCYIEGYSIHAGIHPARLFIEQKNGCKSIDFVPAAPYFINTDSQLY